jgi:hypothetical protein
MAKTYKQLEAERRQRLEARQKFLMEFPEVYQKDFDMAFKSYLQREFPEIDVSDCDLLFNPLWRRGFLESLPEEAWELCQRYHLLRVWDPDGDKTPQPVSENPVRPLHRQDERTWLDRVRPEEGVICIDPFKTQGRFLLVEVDLNKPRREIAASFDSLIEAERMKLLTYHKKRDETVYEFIPPKEPRDRSEACNYPEMEVFMLVEKAKMADPTKQLSKIFTKLAKERYKKEGWDKHYGDDLYDPPDVDRITGIRKALKNAYERDRKLYFGE